MRLPSIQILRIFTICAVLFASMAIWASTSAQAESLFGRSSQGISQEIAGLSAPDAPILLASAVTTGSAIEAARRALADARSGAELAQYTQRSSGCSTGCSNGCSNGCSTGCSYGCR